MFIWQDCFVKGRFFSKRFMKIYTFPIFHQFFPLNFWRSLWLVGFEFKFLLSANHKLRQNIKGKNWWKIRISYIFINLFEKKLLLPRNFCGRCEINSYMDLFESDFDYCYSPLLSSLCQKNLYAMCGAKMEVWYDF